MADRIEIDLTVKSESTNPSESLQPKTTEQKQSKEMTKNQSFNMVVGAGAAMVSKGVSYASSHVGEWTGSSSLQYQIGLTQQLAGIGAGFLINPAVGAFAAIYTIGTSAIDYSFKLNWKNKEINELQRRSGGYLSNRSR